MTGFTSTRSARLSRYDAPGGSPGGRSALDGGQAAMFAACGDGVLIICRADGLIAYANRSAERMFQQTEGGLLGTEFGEPVDGSEVDLVGSGERAAEMRVTEIIYEGATAWLVMLRDVSERVRTLQAAQQERDQAQTLAEWREALLQEVSHRAHNTFAMLSGLMRLQRRTAASPDLAEALSELTARVDALGRSLTALNSEEEAQSVRMRAFLPAMLDDLSALNPNITLRYNIEDVALTAAQAQNVGLIVHECVRNASKYAYPLSKSGDVVVSCRQGESIQFKVVDYGVGFDSETPARGGGLGRALNETFARVLGAEIHTRSGPGGTVCTLTLPSDDA